MKKRVNKIINGNVLRVILVCMFLTLLMSCNKDYDRLIPDSPSSDVIELEDYIGTYTLMKDKCHESYNEYEMSIVEDLSVEGQESVVLLNFNNQEGNTLFAFLKNGRLDIPIQKRMPSEYLDDIEGYMYKKNDGIRIALRSHRIIDNHLVFGICEMHAAKVK